MLCISGIGVLLVVFLGGINEIYDFFISIFFICLCMANFFQISKMIFSNFFHFKFSWWHKRNSLMFFSFLSSGMTDSFQNFKMKIFISNFKNENSVFCHVPMVVWPFFQNSKTRNFISNFKNVFSDFCGGINEIFSRLEAAKFI
jgi:hypothetical protein